IYHLHGFAPANIKGGYGKGRSLDHNLVFTDAQLVHAGAPVSVMSWVSSGFLSEFLASRGIASLEIESAHFDRLIRRCFRATTGACYSTRGPAAFSWWR